MRRTLSALLLATTSVSAIAADKDDHYYAGFELGLTSSPDAEFSNDRDMFSLEADKNLGPLVGFYFGKRYGKSRFELEYAFASNYFDEFDQDTSSVHFAQTGEFAAGGRQKTQTFMGNYWRELAKGEKWSLLAGAGVGMAHLAMVDVRSGSNQLVSDRSWAPAGQLMAEMVRPFGSGLEFGIGFKMMRSTKADFNTRLGRINYHAKQDTIFARLSWRFGANEASRRSEEPAVSAAPAPAPVAAPAPTPAPAAAPTPVKPVAAVVQDDKPPMLPKPFIVYFAFDKSDISTNAARTIRDAAAAYRKFRAIEIAASGHTDSAGPSAYNDKLALQRAEAVRDALVREGVPSDKIIIAAEGENDPLEKTEDGVRNDRNRRVEIKLVR